MQSFFCFSSTHSERSFSCAWDRIKITYSSIKFFTVFDKEKRCYPHKFLQVVSFKSYKNIILKPCKNKIFYLPFLNTKHQYFSTFQYSVLSKKYLFEIVLIFFLLISCKMVHEKGKGEGAGVYSSQQELCHCGLHITMVQSFGSQPVI